MAMDARTALLQLAERALAKRAAQEQAQKKGPHQGPSDQLSLRQQPKD
jgi:hypothetical protein